MTREEAIARLKVLTDYEYYEALEMAIKVLEQEPCEDAISRRAVLDKFEKYTGGSFGYGCVWNYVRNSPSVIPQEPKIGHWILQSSNKEQDERDFIWWKCSKCGQVIYSETEQDRRKFHAFCGRCGARMVEPPKSEDKE